jgi:hypothetical protein
VSTRKPKVLTHRVYFSSETTPNFQMHYFMFDWSIYRLFVLNSGWKCVPLQMMIFLIICSTWSMVELKTRIEAWITRNDVNVVRFFHLLYLITLRAYLCSQRTPTVQINYFMFDWSIYRLFVLNNSWKHDSLQIMLFVYVSTTWSIVELETRFEAWITRNDEVRFTFLT